MLPALPCCPSFPVVLAAIDSWCVRGLRFNLAEIALAIRGFKECLLTASHVCWGGKSGVTVEFGEREGE